MTLHGWRLLIKWSLEHSCIDKAEFKAIYSKWEDHWNKFVRWIIETYGNVEKLSLVLVRTSEGYVLGLALLVLVGVRATVT